MVRIRRTTHRSRTGRKLYAIRDAGGRFKDILTFERARKAGLLSKDARPPKAKAIGGGGRGDGDDW
jgi:hypothetical protein